ncbi:MAG: hypothetical protein F2795_09630 [Actinobacteria bacterium]|nr:hypothetical protein [Actinomycetota bacterium]
MSVMLVVIRSESGRVVPTVAVPLQVGDDGRTRPLTVLALAVNEPGEVATTVLVTESSDHTVSAPVVVADVVVTTNASHGATHGDGVNSAPNPNCTLRDGDRFEPEIVTVVPAAPASGQNPDTSGAGVFVTVRIGEVAWPSAETMTRPVTASEGTTAVICVPAAFTVAASAGNVPKVTIGNCVKFEPTMVTVSPGFAEVGEMEAITGCAASCTSLVTTIPSLKRTDTGPVVKPRGATATIPPCGPKTHVACAFGQLSRVTLPTLATGAQGREPKADGGPNGVQAGVPLNCTATGVEEEGLTLEIVTNVTGLALIGWSEMIAGLVMVRATALTDRVSGVITVRLPVVAFAGTFTVTLLLAADIGTAVFPLKLTEFTAERLNPLMVTVSPAAAVVGLKEVTLGDVGVNDTELNRLLPSTPVSSTSVTEI